MAKIFISRRSQPGGGGARRAGPVILAPSAPYRYGFGGGGRVGGGKPGESGKAEGGQQATS